MVQLVTTPESVVSHWHQLLEGMRAAPSAFYTSVEAALKARCVPDTEVSRVEYEESGLASAKRQYLHITRGRLVFDVCAAPFGNGFFVSSWLAETKPRLPFPVQVVVLVAVCVLFGWLLREFGLLNGAFLFGLVVMGSMWTARYIPDEGRSAEDFVLALPLLGWLYALIFIRDTYYAQDTTLMFQDAVHNSVMQAVDGLTSQHGLRALTEAERKPIRKDFFARQTASWLEATTRAL